MESTQKSRLLASLSTILEGHRGVFRQERTFGRCGWMAIGMLLALGRKTVSQVIVALGCSDENWSAFYRVFSCRRFDYDELAFCLLREMVVRLLGEGLAVMAVDVTHLYRSSLKMPLTAWAKGHRTAKFKPGIERAQRYSHLSLLCSLEEGFSRAFPLRMLPAPTEKSVPCGYAPIKEWEAGLRQIEWARRAFDRLGLRAKVLLVLLDGSYDVNALFAGVPDRVVVLVRAAKNRCLHWLADEHSNGPDLASGERAPKPSDYVRKRNGWLDANLCVRGRDRLTRYRVEGPFLLDGASGHPVFLIAVGGVDRVRYGKRQRIDPRCYLVSAVCGDGKWQLPMPAEKLLVWAWQRWEIEVCHRELKTSFGMGQAQCWNTRSAVLNVQWAAWAFSVTTLAGYDAWGGLLGSHSRRRTRWYQGGRRWSYNDLWTHWRAAFWEPEHPKPIDVWSPCKPETNDVLGRPLPAPATAWCIRG